MRRIGVWLVVAATGVTACERVEDVPDPAVRDTTATRQPQQQMNGGEPVEIQLTDAQGSLVGEARLAQQTDGVEIQVHVSGLAPNSEHGIHFHQNGTCTPPTFESAGDHFNPTNAQHGLENPQGPHAGDMPNIRAGEDGVADTTFVKPAIRLRGDSISLAGRALIVHAQRDDQRTDPSGESGDRIACGVVEVQGQ